ncbi:tRNA1(Val) (adenine(37)-N6)-methyltransferase [Mucilaginibacter dorajii]|uniref:tRNA1(Val) (adenine(37)-N6)-methyltransferase n=1 Tax=Mucilaginibacter dorajii TaxID=692994 RepID=A0ABP7QCW1_9SPHI|nr:methyltransferase [Mucilaginibacter dorajii]MCS3733158.1 tRNA1Val (adenine37-N6)-methyltransferase [Mucilaginibacter dorajii]
MFHFKQFSVDQTGCAMKINTDGVLLGALTEVDKPLAVLDIGTGTGVIALMLAQRFPAAQIDAVEIDEAAANTAANNFKNSPFKDRLTLYATDFKSFFDNRPEKKYDLIVSNPPFYINSLQSPGAKKNQAKHAGDGFFDGLIEVIASHLANNGICWLVLPRDTSALVKTLAASSGLSLQKIIKIHSFKTDEAHREILAFGLQSARISEQNFVIYDAPKIYSQEYQAALRGFLTIF